MSTEQVGETKVCPRCNEIMQVQAPVCSFCGYHYRTGRAATESTNQLAVASLVFGILWVFGLGSILALLFGYRAKRQMAASGGSRSGSGIATAGIVLGWIGVVVVIGILLVVIGFVSALSMSPE